MDIGFTLLKIKWAYQERAMWRRFKDWAAWTLAFNLPRRVALFAFVRVCAETGDSPSDISYDSAYKAWEVKGRQRRP